jgi:chemotaxis protein CheX
MSAQISEEPARLVLPKVMDLASAAPLKAELLARRGGPLELDGSEVQRMGGLAVQLLLSAQTTWAADGQPFRAAESSDAMREALANLGATLAEESIG